MCCKMPKPGYAGQRYEVSCLGFGADDSERRVVGWTNNPTGGALVEIVDLHPSWHSPEVKDLTATTAE